MTGIAKGVDYLSATDLLLRKYASAKGKSRTNEEIVLEDIRRTDPKSADTLTKRLADGKQAVAQLREVKSNAAALKKAAAKEKIRQIKEQIKMLKMMGGDPKMIARQIAQLARLLAAAAREYASAVGMGSQKNTASADTAISVAGGNAVSSNIVSNGTKDSSTAVAADVSPTAVSIEAPASREKEEKDKGGTQESETTSMTGIDPAEVSRQYQEAQQQKMKNDVEKDVGEIKEKALEAEENREVANDLRSLAVQLKEMAKRLKKILHKTGDHTEDQNLTKINQVLADVEKSVSVITGNRMSPISAFA